MNAQTITSDTTWTLAGSPYRVLGTVTVAAPGGPTLTIEPGVEVRFGTNGWLDLGSGGSPGALNANGTVAEPILFTSDQATKNPGDWLTVRFQSPATGVRSYVQNATFEYSGRANYDPVWITTNSTEFRNVVTQHNLYEGFAIWDSAPTIVNLTARDNGASGLWLWNAEPHLVGGAFINNTYGVFATSSTSGAKLDGVAFASNRVVPARLPTDTDFSTATFTGDAAREIELNGGDLSIDHSWPLITDAITGDPYAYAVVNTFTIHSASTLTIEPGVQVLGDPSTTINVGRCCGATSGGNLSALGTEAAPIVFTSRTGSAATGWNGLYFRGDQVNYEGSVLRNVTLGLSREDGLETYHYAGLVLDNVTADRNALAGVYITGGLTSPIRNLISTASSGHGAHFNGGTVTWTGGAVRGAGGSGLRLTASALATVRDVTFEHITGNYGVDASGPGDRADLEDVRIWNVSGRAIRDRINMLSTNLDVRNASITELEYWGGDIVADRTLAPVYDGITGDRYDSVLLSSFTIRNGATWTIAPDTRLLVGGNVYFNVGTCCGSASGGNLSAEGTSALPIYIGSRSGYAGTNGTGWYGAYFRGDQVNYESSTVRNVTFALSRDDGVETYNYAGLTLDNVTFSDNARMGLYLSGNVERVRNITSLRSGTNGVQLTYATMIIDGATITEVGNAGVYTSGCGMSTLQGVTITDVSTYGVYADSNCNGAHLDGVIINGTGGAPIRNRFDARDDATLLATGARFIEYWGVTVSADRTIPRYFDETNALYDIHLISSPVVTGNVTLTILPGSRILYANNVQLQVGAYGAEASKARLAAEGTAADPIYFGPTPSATLGGTRGLYLYGYPSSGSTHLANATFEGFTCEAIRTEYRSHAGADFAIENITIRDSGTGACAAFAMFTTGGTVRSLTIEDATGPGAAYFDGSSTELTDVTISGAAGFGARAVSSSVSFDKLLIDSAGSHGYYSSGCGVTSLRNATIESAGAYGVYADSYCNAVDLNDVRIWNATGRPWRNRIDRDLDVDIRSAGIPELEYWGTTFTRDFVLPAYVNESGTRFTSILLSSVVAHGDTTFTISPGSRVLFDNNVQLQIGSFGGTDSRTDLVAEGTEADPIYFGPNADSVLRGSRGLYLYGYPESGSTSIRNMTLDRFRCEGLRADYRSHGGASFALENVTILNSGTGSCPALALYTTAGDVRDLHIANSTGIGGLLSDGAGSAFTNVTIENVAGYGARFVTSTASLNGGVITNAGGVGVSIGGCGVVTLSNVSIDGASTYGVDVEGTCAGADLSDVHIVNVTGRPFRLRLPDHMARVTFGGVSIPEVEYWGGTITADRTLAPMYDAMSGIKFSTHLLTSATFTSGAVFTLEPGLVLTMSPNNVVITLGSCCWSGATLDARGTAAQPIVIRRQVPGSPWGRLYFYYGSSTPNVLANVTVDGGGYSANWHNIVATNGVTVHADNLTSTNAVSAGIVVTGNAVVNLSKARLNNNAMAGAWADSGTLRLTNVNLSGNVQDGVELRNSATLVSRSSTYYQNGRSGLNITAGSPTLDLDMSVFQRNVGYGIDLQGASGNTISNNAFLANGAGNAHATALNAWNVSKTLGLSLAGGNYRGGNVWSDYAGEDTDGDGIGDTLVPYINGLGPGMDALPLIGTLFADFSYDRPDPVGAPRSFDFQDESRGGISPITNRSWTLGDGTAEYVPSFSHTFASDGVYTVSISVSNDNGQYSSWSENVTVDATVPIVANLTSGLPPQDAASSVNIRVDASDNLGVNGVHLRWSRDGGAPSVIPMTIVSGTRYQANIPAALTQANITYFATVTDTVGNIATTSVENYTTSKRPVMGPVTYSPLYPRATENVAITALITDDRGVASARVAYTVDFIPREPIDMVFDSTDGLWHGVIPATGTNSTVRFNVEARDTDDLSRTSSQLLYVTDSALPVVTVSFVPGAPNGTATIQVRASIVEARGVDHATLNWSFDGGAPTIIEMTRVHGALYTADLPAMNANGSLVATAHVFDLAGNEGVDTGVVAVDAIPPTLTALTGPLPPRLADIAVPIGVNVTDNMGVAQATIHYEFAGGATATRTMTRSGERWTGTIPATGTAAVVTYRVVARDLASNTNTSITESYETSMPPTLGAITRTPVFPQVFDDVEVTVAATDDLAVANATLTYELDGFPVAPVAMTFSNGVWTGTIPAPGFNTTAEFRVHVGDDHGFVNTSGPIAFPFDSAPPVVALEFAPAYPNGASAVEARATVEDVNPLTSVILDWDFEDGAITRLALTETAPGLWTGTLPPTGATGVINGTVNATDAAGSIGAGVGSVRVDATPPMIVDWTQVTATHPRSASVPITVHATDNMGLGHAVIHWSVDAGAWQSTTALFTGRPRDASLVRSIPATVTTSLVDYYVEVVDAAGNNVSSPILTYRTAGVPVIFDVIIAPAQPDDTDAIDVSALITSDNPLVSVMLNYAVANGPVSDLAMSLNADRWEATIPATGMDALVTFEIRAVDDASFVGTNASSFATDSGPPTIGTLGWSPGDINEDSGAVTFSVIIADPGAGVDPATARIAWRIGTDAESFLALTKGSGNVWTATLAGVDWDARQRETAHFRVLASDFYGKSAAGATSPDYIDPLDDLPILIHVAPAAEAAVRGVSAVEWACTNDDDALGGGAIPCDVTASYFVPHSWADASAPNYFSQGTYVTIGQTTASTLPWDTSASTMLSRIRYEVGDTRNTLTVYSPAFSVDNTLPTVTVSNGLAAGRYLVAPDGLLSGAANGTTTSVTAFAIDDGDYALETDPVGQIVSPFAFRVPATATGDSTVTLTVTDRAGNTAPIMIPLRVDASPPSVSDPQSTPASTAAPITMSVIATDDNGISAITVRGATRDAPDSIVALGLNTSSGRYEGTFFAPRTSGTFAYLFTATDAAGTEADVSLDVFVNAGPDPAVLIGDLTADSPLVTDSSGTLVAHVRNVGGVEASATGVRLTYNGALLANASTDVPAGGATEIPLTFSTAGLVGDTTLVLTLVPGPGIYDANVSNNAIAATFFIDAPDLSPVSVIFDPATNATSGLPVGVIVSVTNTRTVTATGVRVDLRVGSTADTGTVASAIVDVGADTTLDVPLVWDTAGFAGLVTVRAFVDPLASVPDLDRSNQVFTTTYLLERFVPEQPPETLRFVRVPVPSASGARARGVASADFDQDARMDFAVADASGNVVVYTNNGTLELDSGRGVAIDLKPTVVAQFGRPAYGLASGDLDRDGVPDLVVGLADGRVMFLPRASQVGMRALLDTGDFAYGITVGDYDGDGDLDLAVGNARSHVEVYRNDGNATFALQGVVATRVEPFGLTSGDFDLNGHVDILVGDRLGQIDRLDNGPSGFSSVLFADIGSYAHALTTADFDLNGRMDFVALGAEGDVSLFYQRAGVFVINPLVVTRAPQTFGLASGDFNGDGKVDLVTASENGTIAVHLSSIYIAKTLDLDPVATTSDFEVRTVVENPYARPLEGLDLAERFRPEFALEQNCVWSSFVCRPYHVSITGPRSETVYVLFPNEAFRVSAGFAPSPVTAAESSDGWVIRDVLDLLDGDVLLQRERITYTYTLQSVASGTFPISTRADYKLQGPPGSPPLVDLVLSDDVSNVLEASANSVNPTPRIIKTDHGFVDETAIPSDLELVSLTLLSGDESPGFRVRATVRNNAPVLITDVNFRFTSDAARTDGSAESVQNGLTFAAGQTRTLDWRVMPRVSGEFPVTGEVNFDRRTVESDYSNNLRALIADAPDIDLAITAAVIDHDPEMEGRFGWLNITVENRGTDASSRQHLLVSALPFYTMRIIDTRSDATCDAPTGTAPTCTFASGAPFLEHPQFRWVSTDVIGPGASHTFSQRVWFGDEDLHSEGTRSVAALVTQATPYLWDTVPENNGATAWANVTASPPDLVRRYVGHQAFGTDTPAPGIAITNPSDLLVRLGVWEENAGGTDAGPHVLDASVEGSSRAVTSLLGLAKHSIRYATIDVDFAAFAPGDRVVDLTFDARGDVAESRESNNATSVLVKWKDPAASSLTLSTSTPAPGDVVQATVTIANLGDLRTGPFPVSFYVDGVLAGNATISLLAHESTRLVFPFTVPPAGANHRILVAADDPDTIPAEPTANNNVSRTFTTAGWEFHMLATGEDAPTLDAYAWSGSWAQAPSPFSAPMPSLPFAPEPRFHDFDGDGDLDLALGALEGSLRMFRNDGSVLVPAPWATPEFDAGFRSIAGIGDLTGDGRADILMGTTGDGWAIGIRASGATPAWSLGNVALFGIDEMPHLAGDAPLIMDVNGDGVGEIIVGHVDGTLSVFERTSTDSWESRPWLDGHAVAGYAVPAAGDVDGDGLVDLVIGASDGSVTTLFGSSLVPPAWTTGPVLMTAPFAAPALADTNGDGALDLVLGTQPAGLQPLKQGYAYDMPWKVVNHDTSAVTFTATHLDYVDGTGAEIADVINSPTAFTVPAQSSSMGTFTIRVPREIPVGTRLEGSLDAVSAIAADAWTTRPDLGGYGIDISLRDGRRYEVDGAYALFDGSVVTPFTDCPDWCPVRGTPASGTLTLVAPTKAGLVRYDRQTETPLTIVAPAEPPIEMVVSRLGDGPGIGLKPGYIEHVHFNVTNRNRIAYTTERIAIEVQDGPNVYDLFTDTSAHVFQPSTTTPLSYAIYVPDGLPVGATVRVSIVERTGLPDNVYQRSSEGTWSNDPVLLDESVWGIQRVIENSATTLRRHYWMDSTVERAEFLAHIYCAGSINVSVNRITVAPTFSAGCLGAAQYGWTPAFYAFQPGSNEISYNVTGTGRTVKFLWYDHLADTVFEAGVVAPEKPAWVMHVSEYGARGAGFLRREYPEPVNLTIENNDDDPFTVSVMRFSLRAPGGRLIPLETSMTPRIFAPSSSTSETYTVLIPASVPLESTLHVTAERLVGFPDTLWKRDDESSVNAILDPATDDSTWGDSVPPTDATQVRKSFFAPLKVTRSELLLGGGNTVSAYLNNNFQGAGFAGWSPISARATLRAGATNVLSVLDNGNGIKGGSFPLTESVTYVGETFEGGRVVEPEEPPFYAILGIRTQLDVPARGVGQIYEGEEVTARVLVTNLLPVDRNVSLTSYAVDLATGTRTEMAGTIIRSKGESTVYVELTSTVPADAGADLRLQLGARWNDTLVDRAWLRGTNFNDASASNPLLNDSTWGHVTLSASKEYAKFFRKHLWVDDRVEDVWLRARGADAVWINGVSVPVATDYARLAHNEANKAQDNVFTLRSNALDADADIRLTRFLPVRTTDLTFFEPTARETLHVEQGDATPISFIVVNGGDLFGRAYVMNVTVDGRLLTSENLTTHPFSSDPWTLTLDTSSLLGDVEVVVELDTHDVVIETTETNNRLVIPLRVDTVPVAAPVAPIVRAPSTRGVALVQFNATDADGDTLDTSASVTLPDGSTMSLPVAFARGMTFDVTVPVDGRGISVVDFEARDAHGHTATARAEVRADLVVALDIFPGASMYALGDEVPLAPDAAPTPTLTGDARVFDARIFGARDDVEGTLAPGTPVRVSTSAFAPQSGLLLLSVRDDASGALLCEARASRDPSCAFLAGDSSFTWRAEIDAFTATEDVTVDGTTPTLTSVAPLPLKMEHATGRVLVAVESDRPAVVAFGRDATYRFHKDRTVGALSNPCAASGVIAVCALGTLPPTVTDTLELVHVSGATRGGASTNGATNLEVLFDVAPSVSTIADDYDGSLLAANATLSLNADGFVCVDRDGACAPDTAFAAGEPIGFLDGGVWHLRYSAGGPAPVRDVVVLVNEPPTIQSVDLVPVVGRHAVDLFVTVDDPNPGEPIVCSVPDASAPVVRGLARLRIEGPGPHAGMLVCADGASEDAREYAFGSPNLAPAFIDVPSLFVTAGEDASLDLAGYVYDAEGDPVTLGFASAPAPIGAVDLTGTLLQYQAAASAGADLVCLVATDAHGASSAEACINVQVIGASAHLVDTGATSSTAILRLGVDFWDGSDWVVETSEDHAIDLDALDRIPLASLWTPWNTSDSPRVDAEFDALTFRTHATLLDAVTGEVIRHADGTPVEAARPFMVIAVNYDPVLFEIPDQEVWEGEILVMHARAADPNNANAARGDDQAITITYSAPFADSDAWQTDYDDAGEYVATATASDGLVSVSRTFNITVHNTDRPALLQIDARVASGDADPSSAHVVIGDPDNANAAENDDNPTRVEAGSVAIGAPATIGVESRTGRYTSSINTGPLEAPLPEGAMSTFASPADPTRVLADAEAALKSVRDADSEESRLSALAALATFDAETAARSDGSLADALVALARAMNPDAPAAETDLLRVQAASIAAPMQAPVAKIVWGAVAAVDAREAALAGIPLAERATTDPALLKDRVDMARMTSGAAALLAAIDEALPELRMTSESHTVEPVLMPPFLAIRGTDADVWDEDSVIMIDLGGDDSWTNAAGASGPTSGLPVSVAIDLGGVDTYARTSSTTNANATLAAQGAGILGIGVLMDYGSAGDAYSAEANATPEALTRTVPHADVAAQGAGVAGVGILIDDTGPDTFVARAVTRGGAATTHAQGAGMLGIGLLVAENVTGASSFVATSGSTILHVAHSNVSDTFAVGSALTRAHGAGHLGAGALILTGDGSDDAGAVYEARADGPLASTLAQGAGETGAGILSNSETRAVEESAVVESTPRLELGLIASCPPAAPCATPVNMTLTLGGASVRAQGAATLGLGILDDERAGSAGRTARAIVHADASLADTSATGAGLNDARVTLKGGDASVDAQGAGVSGVGVLFASSGADASGVEYAARADASATPSTGSGNVGIAIARGGDAAARAQGYGADGGAGIFVDAAGSDAYLVEASTDARASGATESTATPGTVSWQGRGHAGTLGLGALLDVASDAEDADAYSATPSGEAGGDGTCWRNGDAPAALGIGFDGASSIEEILAADACAPAT